MVALVDVKTEGAILLANCGPAVLVPDTMETKKFEKKKISNYNPQIKQCHPHNKNKFSHNSLMNRNTKCF